MLGGCATDPDQRASRMHKVEREVPALLRGPADLGPDAYIAFTFFREGNPGMFLAMSRDGYTWKTVGDAPVMTSKFWVRDPSVAQGPDGRFHMVFTGGGESSIGYSSSTDLLNWTEERALKVMDTSPPTKGCWAPEIVYDDSKARWFLAWSSEVPGRFEETAGQAKVNHRFYYTTTTDFKTLEPAKLLLDPGYTAIDSTFVKSGAVWRMFFKDERDNPSKKQVRMATARELEGPYEGITDALTLTRVEAPCAVKLGDDYLVYFDEYRWGRYGAIRSRDLVNWSDVSGLMDFPKGSRHGCVFRVPPEVGRALWAKTGSGAS